MSGDDPIDSWRAQSIEALTERFRQAGVSDDPTGWAGSELAEDIPQYTRYLFLRGVWQLFTAAHQECVEVAVSSAGDTAPTGPDLDELSRSLAGVLGDLAFSLLYHLSAPGGAGELGDDDPAWALMEVMGELGDATLTGREVGGLHESLWETHPEDEEGAVAGGWLR